MSQNSLLPIHEVLPRLREALRSSPCAVLSAPPGSGKTTVVPPALLAEQWLEGRTIVMLEPRRLAARLAASFMAEQHGEEVGRTIGYRVRFDSRVSGETRIEVVTEGIFTRRLQSDPELTGVGLVIFDEFHERGLEGDLALALCLDVMAGLRDDLRLLVMSATLDTAPLGRFLDQAPVIAATGVVYPVEVAHFPPPAHLDTDRSDHIALHAASGIRRALAERSGDILAFLPGAGEIRRAMELLAPLAAETGFLLLPLYGDLSLAEQGRAVRPDPQGRRRVILATNIAETSITIQGVDTVVDCGWKRHSRFNPDSGLAGLATGRISRAAANQRQGRAGRLGPGFCYRLWSPGVEHGLLPFDRPEIMEADLAPLLLELAAWGVADPARLRWLDPPPAGAVAQARELLVQLDALDDQGLVTPMGREMAGLPLHPRLAHMVLQGRERGSSALACDLAALLSERDLLKGRDRSADIEDRLHLLQVYRREGAGPLRALDGDPGVCRRIDLISRQIGSLLRQSRPTKHRPLGSGALSALAFPDRIARQRPEAAHHYKLTSGRGVRLAPHDRLIASSFLAVASLDAGQRDGKIFLAAPLDREEIFDLFKPHLRREESVAWDERIGGVVGQRRVILGALAISESAWPDPGPEKVRQVLLEAIAVTEPTMLPWTDRARNLQARVECLRQWDPRGGWPDFSDRNLLATLAEWLGPWLDSIRTRDRLQTLNLETILMNRLDWAMRQRLEQEAPTHIEVPSGSRIRLQYAVNEPPVLAVRLQELFGLAQTPAICFGRVPVLLHLLSPAGRPIQITADLANFWNSAYHEVKKELKGRYPKHHWPDDPWQATPTARAKPRKR